MGYRSAIALWLLRYGKGGKEAITAKVKQADAREENDVDRGRVRSLDQIHSPYTIPRSLISCEKSWLRFFPFLGILCVAQMPT